MLFIGIVVVVGSSLAVVFEVLLQLLFIVDMFLSDTAHVEDNDNTMII